MRNLPDQFRRVLSDGWRRYFCDEDPDDREERRCEEALSEIDAQVQMALREWRVGLKQSQEREVEAA